MTFFPIDLKIIKRGLKLIYTIVCVYIKYYILTTLFSGAFWMLSVTRCGQLIGRGSDCSWRHDFACCYAKHDGLLRHWPGSGRCSGRFCQNWTERPRVRRKRGASRVKEAKSSNILKLMWSLDTIFIQNKFDIL